MNKKYIPQSHMAIAISKNNFFPTGGDKATYTIYMVY